LKTQQKIRHQREFQKKPAEKASENPSQRLIEPL
jgi:hypothetical protein